jgi:uncharacterized protein
MAQTVSCPICGKAVPFDDPNMPFCSDRCRLIDLGNWASEAYVVTAPAGQNEFEEMPETEPQTPKDRIQ